ncbi:glycosyltransferase family 1 protein [Candidatus Poribacteria bacterium]|nr:glycosyltransferase family 1 protein [Candidatus Poribacteria bacterium]
MKPVGTFNVVPALPEKLQCLREIAYNLYWAWNHDAIDLFRRLDGDLWESTGHNPILVMANVSQATLEATAQDDSFIAHLERVYNHLKEYLQMKTWYEKTYKTENRASSKPLIAYFSAEYGISDCLPIYSGGLGVLSGDHLKSSSDLGIPIVGIGLLYQQGYFHQQLDTDGMQIELYPENDFYKMPIELMRDNDGKPLTVSVKYPSGIAIAQIWKIQVGRIQLLMLDTNIDSNPPEYRDITDHLYTANYEMRLRQEIMLGIGGVRALNALGMDPVVYHINEGHSAFLVLERINHLINKYSLSFNEAKEVVSATSIFTTHTPVPAGIDVFYADRIRYYFEDYIQGLCISFDELMSLGKQNPNDYGENFSMAILALRLASWSNGVSKLHGKVSRKMWKNLWPGVPEDEVPIKSIVNGAHIRSWVSKGMAELFDRYLGPSWAANPSDPGIWKRIKQIPDDELWQTHERRRERLIALARRCLVEQLKRRNALPLEIEHAKEYLNPDALTIGFARRFATYKRAKLILSDLERLKNILFNKNRPVQIIFSGKAHPNDKEGKEIIQEIIRTIKDNHELHHHIIFIEDYDTRIARYLVQGVDLWLSTPRRRQEASSTSGMKAAFNGVINMSVPDGWWYEAYSPEIGWAIGQNGDFDESYMDDKYQDSMDANSIYQLLEKEVVPLFYDIGTDGLPRGWIQKMKTSMATICPLYNTNRMLHEYVEKLYHPCIKYWQELSSDNFAKAKELAVWKSYISQNWSSIRINKVEIDRFSEAKVGEQIRVNSSIYLGNLKFDDVAVEIYEGPMDTQGIIINPKTIPMSYIGSNGDNSHNYQGFIECHRSGLHGYSIRILPRHDKLTNPFELRLILWAS